MDTEIPAGTGSAPSGPKSFASVFHGFHPWLFKLFTFGERNVHPWLFARLAFGEKNAQTPPIMWLASGEENAHPLLFTKMVVRKSVKSGSPDSK